MSLLDLAAKITLDASGFKKGLSKAEGHAKSFGDKLKNGLAVSAKIAVAGLTAVSGAIVKIGKDSVEAYADYEQLVGGVEKIFDQMDSTRILQDAQNAYVNLNMSANEYLSAINSVGAAFSSTMGDEKGYETAKMGMQAIADFASGTGKSVNELNQKYQAITRSTSSYQSIADQFSGILPATSSDFLAQAQAAGYLSESYTQLTQVPIAEYQEAVSKMLQKGTADLGLTNNTAKEAFETIQGSIAATKSAWQNLLVGFADPEQDLGELVNRFLTSAGYAFNNIADRIQVILPNIADGITRLVEGALPILITTITTMLPTLITDASKIFSTVISELIKVAPDLINAILPLSPQLLEAGLILLVELLSGISENLPELVPVVVDVILKMVDVLNENLPTIVQAGQEILFGLLLGLWDALPEILLSIGGLVAGLFKSIWAFMGFDSDEQNQMLEIGAQMIEGLWKGILSVDEWIRGKIKEFTDGIVGHFKEFFGIASPSKLFRDEIGENLALGVGVGFTTNMDDVKKEMQESLPTSFDLDTEVNSSIRGNQPESELNANINKLVRLLENGNAKVNIQNTRDMRRAVNG